MTIQTILTITYFVLLAYCCVYAIVNRICKCVEQRAMMLGYAKFTEATKGMDISKVLEAMSEHK